MPAPPGLCVCGMAVCTEWMYLLFRACKGRVGVMQIPLIPDQLQAIDLPCLKAAGTVRATVRARIEGFSVVMLRVAVW
jgi:hypothetical protein